MRLDIVQWIPIREDVQKHISKTVFFFFQEHVAKKDNYIFNALTFWVLPDERSSLITTERSTIKSHSLAYVSFTSLMDGIRLIPQTSSLDWLTYYFSRGCRRPVQETISSMPARIHNTPSSRLEHIIPPARRS